MSFASLRKRALITAAGVSVAVVVPLAGVALPAAQATAVPTSSTVATSAAASTSSTPLTAAQIAAKKRAAKKKRIAAKKARIAARKVAAKKREIRRGKKLVRVASRYRGRPYVYGASGPRAFDCSGYTSYVVRKALRVNLPRTAAQQRYTGKVERVAKHNRRVGDLIFFHRGGTVGHVAIYAGHGKMWDAPRTGLRINKRDVHGGVKSYGRVR